MCSDENPERRRRSARHECRQGRSTPPFFLTTIGSTMAVSLIVATIAAAAISAPPGLKKPSTPQQLPNVLASYTTFNETVNFTHFVVDTGTGRVYVGATNWLYQFNGSLELEASVQTGPVEDSVLCSPSDCSGVEAEPTDNINKVMTRSAGHISG
ncbi:hypothetical protein MTO96_005398 [Rhipicephalus appendiculatus]